MRDFALRVYWLQQHGGEGVSTRGRKPSPSPEPIYLAAVRDQNAPAAEMPAGDDAGLEIALPGQAPEWLSENEKRVWEFLRDNLTRRKLLDRIDEIQMAILAAKVALWAEMRDKLKELGGHTYKTVGRNGTLHKLRPEYVIMTECERAIGQFGSNFGLSPVDRHRLKMQLTGGGGEDQGGLFD